MSLETILKEIKEVKPFADSDAEDGPIETLAGRRGRKVQATERLKNLKRDYTRELMATSRFILAVGSESDSLVEALTAGKQGLFSADPELFYKDLAGRVNPALLAGRASPSDLLDVICRHLEDKANELDIVAYPQLIFKNGYSTSVTNEEQLVSLIKTAVNEQMGSEIVGIQAVNSILDNAIEKEHSSSSTSIVLNVKDADFALRLFDDLKRIAGKIDIVVAGESRITGDVVSARINEVNEKTLKQVVNALKGKKNV